MRCPQCHYQGSRTAYTPLHHFKLPLWTFGYILTEAMQLHPQVLNTASIQRKLGVSSNSAILLKRRLQLFLSEFIPDIKALMVKDIDKEFGDSFRFPKEPEIDLSKQIEEKPVIYADTVALFSARERSNGYRKRYKHHGQTASIYLSDSVADKRGKYQIGTLVHTIGIKKGPVIFDSVPDQKQHTIKPLFDFLPANAPTFTDEGYPWLKRYNDNHRSVNHSARAKDKKRNVWARDRWSKNGVHNQVAEGNQRIIKHAFITGYSYIRPEFSQLYLDEYSALKGLRVYGFERILDLRGKKRVGNVEGN
ncbi:MAG: hypothetical protein KA369_20380 [Spirochaetes bacterium]|nr:hypothetical protein [Spirochaetota bacterium]